MMQGRLGKTLLGLCLTGALLLNALAALAAERVRLRAGVHEGFGRIVFDLATAVGYSVDVDGVRLRVTFKESVDFDTTGVAAALEGYVGAPRIVEAGRVVEFPLKGRFETRHFTLDGKVVVDLLGPGIVAAATTQSGTTQSATTRSSRAQQAQEQVAKTRVRVRIGEHPGFSRLVFDWRKDVESRLRQQPGKAEIIFDRAADFDLSRFHADPPPGIKGVSVRPQGSGVAVTLSVDTGATVRLSQSGSKQVVDVVGADLKPAKPAATTKVEPTLAQVRPRKSSDVTPPAIPKKQAAAVPPSAQTKNGEKAPPRAQAASALSGPTSLLPEALKPSSGKAAKPSQADKSTKAAQADTSAKGDQTRKNAVADKSVDVPQAAKKAQPAAKSQPANNTQPVNTAKIAANVGQNKRAAGAIATDGDAIQVPRTKGSLRAEADVPAPSAETPPIGRSAKPDVPVILTFEWDEPAAAAAFRRGPHIWLVFDRPAPDGMVERISAASPDLEPIVQLDLEGATVLRLTAQSLLAPRLTQQDNVWTVDIRARSAVPESTISARLSKPRAATTAIGQHVRFAVTGAGRMQWFEDPDQGDQLVAIPVTHAGAGVPESLDYPQFQVLASQQGVVLRPLSDGVEVATTKRAVLVREREGLLVSSSESRDMGSLDRGVATPPRRLFELAAWRRGPAEDFTKLKQELQNALVKAEGNDLAIARLDLARFYFAHGRGSETLGLLRVIEAETPHLARDPEILMMKAASEIIIEDYDSAGQSLAHPALLDEWEAQVWRAALAAAAQDWEAATLGFSEVGGVIEEYAHPIRNRLNLWAAESRLGAGDGGGASLYLSRVRKDDPTEAHRLQMLYLTGRQQSLEGDTKLAAELWRRVVGGNHPPSPARARLAL